MTSAENPPVDPDTVAEVTDGPLRGSVEYGGDDIKPGGTGATTTEAGTFTDLPVTAEEQGD